MRSSREIPSIPLAIIGMGCRLPGADNLDEYWRLIVEGRYSVKEVSADRLDQDLYFDPRKGVRGKTYSKLGGVVSDRPLDRRVCPLPPDVERSIDVAHARMCEVAAAACRHAGMDPFDLPIRNVGVYIGHAQGSRFSGDCTYATCMEEAAQFLLEIDEFRELPAAQQREIIAELVSTIRGQLPRRSPDSPDVGACMVAGAISKAFGLTGPFMALNSACASSLQTMLLAARALQLGRVDMAIAGGASDIKGDTLVLFSAAQAMSATGSRPFDADADGLICAEGYVAVVMKTLERALADGDPIQAVVRGFGVASDGRGKSLWAPRKEGQIAAMQQAYRYGVEVANVQYIEAHATATQLGDATELETLNEVFKKHLAPGKKIPVTSVKANIGHTLEAAGMAGVIKTVLCMQNRIIPPAINIRRLNPKIDWASASVYIPQAPAPWPAPADRRPRAAGVNAFGIGGLNMHVALEEFTEAAKTLVPVMQPDSATAAGAATGSEQDAIAIIGMGCILPGAPNLDAFWELLRTGRDPKSHAPADRWRADLSHEPGAQKPFKSPITLGGYITDFHYDWRIHKLPPMQIAQADPLQFMLLEAADQAFKDAGYDKKTFDRSRVGVIVGTEFGGDFAFQLQVALRLPEINQVLERLLLARNLPPQSSSAIPAKFADKLVEHWPALIDESGSFSTSSLASRITKTKDLMGGAAAIDCGSASALSALSSAIDMLQAGDCNMVVCAAGQRRMILPAYEFLSMAGVLSAEEKPRSPLDAEAGGYVPGEGVGVLLLKRLADAQRDGDHIHAIIRALGAARHESPATAMELAIERSLDAGGISPADVALLETDASGIAARDAEQLGAIASAYGQSKRREPLAIGEAIAQIGHTGGASGAASAIKAVHELTHLELPATVGLHSPAAAVAQNASAVRVALAPSPITDRTDDGRLLAAVTSSDRGLTFHAVLERGAKPPAPAAVAPERRAPQTAARHSPIPASSLAPALVPGANQSPSYPSSPMTTANLTDGSPSVWQILRVGANSPEDLRSRLRQLQADPAKAFAQAAASRFNPSDRLRFAVVADTPAALSEKLVQSAALLPGGNGKSAGGNGDAPASAVLENRGIFLRQPGMTRPRIAFMFPGQGSQYAGMLKELIRDVPAARQAMDHADSNMQGHGFQSFAQLAWDAASGAGTDIWVTQSSMLLADMIMLAALRNRGIRPDLVIGHSYGEYVSLAASGAWDFEMAVLATRARCDGIAASRSGSGAMLATNAPPTVVEQLAQRLDEPVYVANYNAPDQVVVGGPKGAIADLSEMLQRNGHQGRILAVPCPFHTPLLKEAAFSLSSALEKLRIDRPTVQFVTAVSNRALSDPDDIRANLVAHMTTPIRFEAMIRAIADDAPTVFVEVGPQQVLTRLVRRILGQDSDAIACDNPKRPGVEQLWCVQALLECTGAWPQLPETAQTASPNAAPLSASEKQTADEWFFDATTRRREKMRKAAGRQPLEPAGAPSPVPVLARARAFEAKSSESIEHLDGSFNAVALAAPDHLNGEVYPTPGVSSATATVRQAAGSKTPTDSELETFLIRFVVEHTGYPAEVVELDADLEADLGIDSIKKAQLFGELREYFDIKPDANLTLDDFPTLRHVLKYLQGRSPEKAIAPLPQVDGKQLASSTTGAEDDAIDGWNAEPRFAERSLAGSTTESLASAPNPSVQRRFEPGAVLARAPMSEPVAVPTLPAQTKQTPNTTELESFLINFVVEHTGYPAEVVELDADLEADLGIDSIKKAQLFGELREYFDIKPDANLTLDDFPTLRHVLNYLQGKAPRKAIDSPPQGNGKPAASSTLHAEKDEIDGWNAQSPYAERSFGGSTAKPQLPERGSVVTPRFEPALAAADAPGSEPVAALTSPAQTKQTPDAAELESFLINFVVEHTGYPAEVVELDADLEADLGIDSIKKAQLFGELREYFDIKPDANLTLDDFPTLRHVLRFLQKAQTAPSPAKLSEPIDSALGIAIELLRLTDATVHETSPGVQMSPGVEASPAAGPWPSPDTATESAPALHNGALYEAALRHGRSEKPRIRQTLRRHADIAGSRFDSSQIHPQGPDDLRTLFTPDQLLELEGIADGAEVAVENIMAHIALRGGDPVFSVPQPDQVRTEPKQTEYRPEQELFDAEQRTQRFVMRMLDAPLDSSTPQSPSWRGPALLIGKSKLNESLRRSIENQGVHVFEIVPTGNVDADLAKLADFWNRQPILHVFLTAARDRDDSDIYSAETWNLRLNQKLLSSFFLCQRWLQLVGEANLIDQCSIVGVAALGGDFGFSGNVSTPEGGAITGLLKGIWMEYTFVRGHKKMIVKTIDAPDDEPPDALSANILRELAAGTMDYEVAFVAGRRRLQNALHQPADLQPQIAIRPGAAWVITGGARGITARCALELGRRFGLSLHLIGTSPQPKPDPSWQNLSPEAINDLKAKVILQAKQSGEPIAKAWEKVEKAIEIDRSLRAFADAGVSAEYHTCDVADRRALAGVLDAIRRSDGPIQGIVHGAGIERSSRFERKNRADVIATLAAKVNGARNLMELTRNDPVEYFFGFGSISGRLGSSGQSDYCMASDLLCKLISWYRTSRPNCHAVGIHWHGWDEFGMAAKPEVQAMFKRTNAPKPMPASEGVRHFIREIFAGAPSTEVMITDWDCYQRFYREGAEEAFRAKPEGSQPAPIAASSAQVSLAKRRPLIESIRQIEGGGHVAEIEFHPTRDVFLTDHRMAGKPFLPGVVGMEAIAEAAQLCNPGRTVVAMRDVEIANGLPFHGDDPIRTQVAVVPHELGAKCRLTSEFRDRKKRLIQSERLIVEAIVEFAPQAQLFDAKPPGRPPQGWFPYLYPAPNEAIMHHGKTLRCLRECCFQYDGGWGKIVAPSLAELAGDRSDQGWIFPAAVLDACLVGCSGYVWIQFSATAEIPYAFRRLLVLRHPREGETCIMRFFFRGRDEKNCHFDFTLFGDDNSVILQAEGYRTLTLGEGADL
jgi:acyl transferase domain-containing protein